MLALFFGVSSLSMNLELNLCYVSEIVFLVLKNYFTKLKFLLKFFFFLRKPFILKYRCCFSEGRQICSGFMRTVQMVKRQRNHSHGAGLRESRVEANMKTAVCLGRRLSM